MDILITNDDGIRSKGLALLAEWADSIGNVTVVAPAEEQSAKSQSLNIRTRYSINEVPFIPGIPAYAVGSTPADCVHTAADLLGLHFDIVFSGINRGFNIGFDIAYSGTCGAIFEAAHHGIPGVAFSTSSETFSGAYNHLDEAWHYIRKKQLLSIAPLWNINFPVRSNGIRLTCQNGPSIPESLQKDVPEKILLDKDAINAGFISVTPLTIARTDFEAFRRVLDS